MSKLVNQNWIAFNGEPVTGRTPPTLIVYGPPMTRQQEGEVAHTYKLFTDANLVALGQYQVRNRVFADGTRVRCVSINGVDTVYVWTVGKEDIDALMGGFVCRPQSGVADSAVWWGKPITSENMPLGTEYGEAPQVMMRSRWDSQLKKAKSEFKVLRKLPELYGNIDWQGTNPLRDVLSWDAQDLGTFTLNSNGTVTTSFENEWWFNASTPISDPTKDGAIVRRYCSQGSGFNLYSRLRVIETYSAQVDGAAHYKADNGAKFLIAVLRDKLPGFYNPTYSFVVKSGGTEHVIGTYPAPFRIATQGWYFNQSGTKARCCFIDTNDGVAIEATITGDTLGTLEVSFAEVANSRGQNLSLAGSSGAVGTTTVDATYTLGDGYISQNNIGTAEGSSWSSFSGISEFRSPAFAADFKGALGTLAYVREKASIFSVSGSENYSKVRTFVDHGSTTTETFVTTKTLNASASATDAGSFLRITYSDGSSFEIKIRSGVDTSIETHNESGSITETNVIERTSGGATISDTTTYSGQIVYSQNQYSKERLAAVDFDLRHPCFVFRSNGGADLAPQASRTYTNFSASYSFSNNTPTYKISGLFFIGSTPLSMPVFETYEVSSSYIAFPGTTTGFPTYPSAATIMNRRQISISGRTLNAIRSRLWHDGASQATYCGQIRTYYGQVCASVSFGKQDAVAESTVEHWQSYITNDGNSDALSLVEIDDKTRPWLFKLGVV